MRLCSDCFYFDDVNLRGRVGWRAPSNIALIKYWGKKGFQLPANPSLSITLKNSYTDTILSFAPATKGENELQYFFEGKRNLIFEQKVKSYIDKLQQESGKFSFLKQFDLKFSSRNSFPHSAGIASSASSMASIALCLASFYQQIEKQDPSIENVSSWARIGSGSACRSLFGPMALWGDFPSVESSSDNFAVSYHIQDKTFSDIQDTILIVDSAPKRVSSTKGHSGLENHAFANVRYQQAQDHLKMLIEGFDRGAWEKCGKIIEREALSLHAMMMSAPEYYTLLKPATLEIIDKIWQYRNRTNIHLFFTLDAGPNIHLLFPKKEKELVHLFIQEELIHLVEQQKIIEDEMGAGPRALEVGVDNNYGNSSF
ncbi:MAG: diphosphomevalonate/mevalonate 3,5-bisphosphate decarboxylase family protein [Bacteriovoracia bacterium]